jgi:hypothetical protein
MNQDGKFDAQVTVSLFSVFVVNVVDVGCMWKKMFYVSFFSWSFWDFSLHRDFFML